jgi:hypothetical protein
MRFLLFVVVVGATCAVADVCGADLEWSGYFENQFFPQELNDKIIFQDYNKLRIDLSVDIAENVSFNSDYIYRIYHGKIRFNSFDFIPERVVSDYAGIMGIPLDSLRPLFDFEYEDENFLDNAYITIYSRHANVRIGKQQLPWGTGYAWNPTDIFNEKNTLDPTYEKVGVNAFKLEVPFGKEGMLTGIAGIGDEWRTSTKALKIKEHFSGFDLSACFVEKVQEGFDFYRMSSVSEKRRLFGGDFSGEFLGVGIWGEGAYSTMKESRNFGQYLLGVDYTFENGLYLIGEYYRNDLGESNENKYTFDDWMRLLSAEGENLGADYVYTGERYPVAELLDWSNYLILNINDKSGLFFPWFDYSLNDDTEIILMGYIPFGGKETEFGEFGPGGFARIRIYF